MPKTIRKPLRAVMLLLLAAAFAAGAYNVYKPLPGGMSLSGRARPAGDIRFLKDVTYVDDEGVRHSRQEIFDEVLAIIRGARELIVLDMFLYNEYQGSMPERLRPLSGELTDALIEQKRRFPGMSVFVITDPINTVYGSLPSEHFRRLREAGISVTETRVERLRDTNPLYSSFWHVLFRPFGNGGRGALPNPFGKGSVTARSWLKLLNFKVNHRKVLVADGGDGLVGLVTSANAHDASSAHGNVAVRFTGEAAHDLLRSEQAVLAFSGGPRIEPPGPAPGPASETSVSVLTERGIERAVLEHLARAKRGDRVSLVMFYLSDRDVVEALKAAHRRGAELRVVLDPNKDSFGRRRNGIPNRQVARELHEEGVPVRWYDTHGEQSHSKMLLLQYGGGRSALILGSANFTRRNLHDLNLETDALITGPSGAKVFADALRYVDLIWHNRPGELYTVSYRKYEDRSLPRAVLYRFMEATGLCTF